MKAFLWLAVITCFNSSLVSAKADVDILTAVDIFDLEYVADINIDKQGKNVYFVRHYMDIQTDRKLGNIWVVNTKSGALSPITTGDHVDYAPTLSPDGTRLAFISTRTGKAQVYMKWLKTGQLAKLTNVTSSPNNLVWSPNGKLIAFSMFVPDIVGPPVALAGKPPGAKWAEPATYIDDVFYRVDGGGYLPKGSSELFVLSSDGGSPRQLTSDEFNNGGKVSWTNDSEKLIFSANRNANAAFLPLDTNIFSLDVSSKDIVQLTDRDGPDSSPQISPNGKKIAYIGFNDKRLNYDNAAVYVMNLDGTETQVVNTELDRSIDALAWAKNSRDIYVQYDDKGDTVLALQSSTKPKQNKILSRQLGGQSYGRPYTSGEFAVSAENDVVFTLSAPDRPADIAMLKSGKPLPLTALNEDAFAHKTLAKVEEIWFESSADKLPIQGWIAYPPGFDETKKYPLILEIHGGPVTAYGPHFSMEIQLLAAPGNVVLYVNPRGSSSYGKSFANRIDKNYPSEDHDDLMSGVDAVIEKGFIDTSRLFITGGSGGGVLTAWAVSQTQRFAAAVVAKPVINWFSFVLTADYYPYFYQYWFEKKPWEDIDTYMKYSPISYVGNVTTPTMLLTGEVDYRTPISETEQYYQALKIQGVDTAMVRIPEASHGIYKKPSQLMTKIEYILWWFNKYDAVESNAEPKAQQGE